MKFYFHLFEGFNQNLNNLKSSTFAISSVWMMCFLFKQLEVLHDFKVLMHDSSFHIGLSIGLSPAVFAGGVLQAANTADPGPI